MSGRPERGEHGDVDDHDDEDDEPITELTVFVVLGTGLLGLFLGFEWFWMVWVFGFAVVLPMMSILEDRIGNLVGGDSTEERTSEDERALERLKQRYADGEIDDLEFERRLERLVENESIDDVKRRVDRDPEVTARDRERSRGDGIDRDRNREADRDREYEFEH